MSTHTGMDTSVSRGDPDGTVVVAAADKASGAAVAYAVADVRRRGGRIRVAHVVPALDLDGLPEPLVIDGETLRRAGFDVVDELSGVLDHELPDTVVLPTVLHGPTVPALVRCARGASRVVLQRRSRGWRRVVAHSTLNGVAAHASAPVVVVPEDWSPDPRKETLVVVGAEGVLTAPHLLAVAFVEAEQREGRLRIVHAWHYDDAYDDLVFAGEAARAHEEVLRTDLLRELGPTLRRHPDVPVDLVVIHGRPADLLIEESDRAGLLVLGRHRPFVSWGPHLGSVVRAVLRESTCPVLVVDTAAEPFPHHTPAT